MPLSHNTEREGVVPESPSPRPQEAQPATPGPWVVGSIVPQQVVKDVGGGDVVHVAMALTAEDARLIAAAPELLEALQAFAGVADPACLVENDHPHSDFAVALNKALAAIAKATGAAQ